MTNHSITRRTALSATGVAVAALGATQVMAQNNPCKTFAPGSRDYLHEAGRKLDGTQDGLYANYVNVKWFRATGNGVTDDMSAIQAAIDYAYAHKIVTVYMPAGHYYCSGPIWLDPPQNGRVDPYTPNMDSNWSLHLIGDGSGGSEFPGTVIYSNSAPETSGHKGSLYVGPGQHCLVAHLQILNVVNNGKHRNQFSDNTGITVLCAGGGAHCTNFIDVLVGNCGTGFNIGGNRVMSMSDSNTLIECSARDCRIGFRVVSTQQFINSLRDCCFENCDIAVVSDCNLNIEVSGGNFSSWNYVGAWAVTPDANSITSFDDSATYPSEGGYTALRFNLHVDSVSTPNSAEPNDCDIWAAVTVHYGVVALRFDSWDPNTRTLSLKSDKHWFNDHNLGNDATQYMGMWKAVVPNIQYVYGCKLTTVFGSSGIHAYGVHIENAGNITRIAHATSGWDIGHNIRLEDINLNWDASFTCDPNAYGPSTFNYGLMALAVVWPAFETVFGRALIVDGMRASGGMGFWRIRTSTSGGTPADISSFRNLTNWIDKLAGAGPDWNHPLTGGIGGAGWGVRLESPQRGVGEFDKPQYRAYGWDYNQTWANKFCAGTQRSPMLGYYPTPWVTPRLWPSEVDILLSNPLPAFPTSPWDETPYPPIAGDTIYSVSRYDQAQIFQGSGAASPREMFVKFNHWGYSWGQKLPGTWSVLTGARCIYLSPEAFAYVFPGLVIGLDFTAYGGSVMWFSIYDIQPNFGYIWVWQAKAVSDNEQWQGSYWSQAVDGQVLTGSALLQQPFSITRLSNLQADALTDSCVAGQKFQVGEKIWKKTAAPGASIGWMCTTAGTAGTDAVFKQLPPLIEPLNYQQTSNAFTITLNNSDQQLVLDPAGTLASGSITMCASPYDSQVVKIRTSAAITALTIYGNTGQSVKGAPTTLTAGGMTEAIYRAANSTWYF